MKLFHTLFCVFVFSVFSLQVCSQNSGLKVEELYHTGNKLQIEVQSTWFPLIARNPQIFVPIIVEASEEDFQTHTPSVFRDSHIMFSEIIN